MTVDVNTISHVERQRYLQHAVAPRPICFASTIDNDGNVNLSPFSFFNLFSITPPILIFSPLTRMRDQSSKDTIDNLKEVAEVVINVVDYEMVQQVSLASCEFPKGTNEFLKAGFTQQPAMMVRPPMVKESKISIECRVTGITSLGTGGGAGNLVICEVLKLHIADSVLDNRGMIDQEKLPLVARLGGDWYCRVGPENLFKVPKPNTELGIGFDQLPETILKSPILTGNNLAQLANVSVLPVVDPSFSDDRLKNIFQYFSINPDDMENEIHLYAKELLDRNETNAAWQVLLATS